VEEVPSSGRPGRHGTGDEDAAERARVLGVVEEGCFEVVVVALVVVVVMAGSQSG